MSTIPFFNAVRIIPRNSDFLDRRVGSNGELFINSNTGSIRIYDGQTKGGIGLVRTDLTNISDEVFAEKARAAGVGSNPVGGNTTVSVGSNIPTSPTNGNLWLNTNNGSLYVYINDGDSNQWIQPAFSTPDLTDYATKEYVQSTVNISEFILFVAADDSSQKRINSSNVIKFTGSNGITTSTDDDGNITITGGGSTGAVTFSGTAIDSADSSEIQFVPSVRLQSDLSIENELFVRTINSIESSIYIPTDVFIKNSLSAGTVSSDNFNVKNIDSLDSSTISVTPSAVFQSDLRVENELIATTLRSDNNLIISAESNIVAISADTIQLGGLAKLSKTSETINQIVGATGTVVHNFENGALFLHSGIQSDFTANFVNIPAENDQSISIALILDQGATAYIPNVVQIEGNAVTIKWSGGSPPSGTNNYIDLVNFTLIRYADSWVVLGTLGTFN